MSRRVAKVKSNGELKHYRRYYSPLETPPDIPVGWRGVRKELPNGWFVDRIPNTGDDAPRNRTWRLIGGGNDTYPNWRYARHFANEIFLAMPLLPATSGGGSSLSHNQAYELGMIDEYGNWLVTDPSDISSSYDSYVEAKSGIFLSASTTEIQNLMKTKYFLLTWNNKPGNESFNGNDGVIKLGLGHNSFLSTLDTRKKIYHNTGYQLGDQIYAYFDFSVAGGDITKLDMSSIDFRECDSEGNVLTTGKRSTYWVRNSNNYDVLRWMDQCKPYGPPRTHLEMINKDCHYTNKGDFETGSSPRYGAAYSELIKASYDVGAEPWIHVPTWIGCPVNHLRTATSTPVSGTVSLEATLAGPHAVANSFSKVSDIGTATTTVNADGTYEYTQPDGYTENRNGGFVYQYEDVLLGVQQITVRIKEQYGSIRVSWRDNDQSSPYPGTSVNNAAIILNVAWHRAFVNHILDEIVASGVPENTYRIRIAIGNEVWNTGGTFNHSWNHFTGLGQYLYDTLSQAQGGALFAAGWMDAMYIKLFKEEQAARGTNYLVTFMAEAQNDNAGSVDDRLAGAFAYCSYNSLTSSTYLNDETYRGSCAMYPNGVFSPVGAYSSGLSGQTTDAANLTWWQDSITTSETATAAAILNWYTEDVDRPENNKRLVTRITGHHADCVARGLTKFECYEGSMHDAMTSNTRDDSICGPFYYEYMPDIQKQVLDDLCTKLVAAIPGIGLCTYGMIGNWGPHTNGNPDAPWFYGTYENLEPSYQTFVEYGRNPA